MDLRFEENPVLRAEQVAGLREAVGWDGRTEKYRRILGNTHCSAACLADDQLVGYVDVVSDGIDDAYVRDLVVHPDYQRRGIGSKLVAMAIERIKGDRIKMVNVLFDPELAEFYRRAGFTIIAGGIIDNEA
jgi:ribosomal protein S18 acetylase RimI-like enzyme